ncbi:LamG-like jellyroll fold domain-containing protein [Fimbriiglobus ruber]|uniref:Glucose dehydrogenase, PQQ-dependent n=1 Tax=Fimbriiglobus ruber TaxID=1908690 RepID=A0A225DYS7_9BACT|nr:LamG-like jellyroll fold domain-containing protein [Fimbriiglobus ruber]OWK46501.1 Glucose dehydrogenase, PQQ-dependent [Fimbriiglobus ruber]
MHPTRTLPRGLFLAVIGLLFAIALPRAVRAADPPTPAPFARDNLVAWCIVPFDAKKRSPEDRVAMLARLGFKKYAYDWRAEHLPTFDRELVALQKHGIELTAVWFPASLDKDAQVLLDGLKKHGIKAQLWVSMNGGSIAASPEEQKKRVAAHAAAIRPIAEAAAKIGCTVALYNHGGWFGEPENQLAILDAVNLANVGIVYNLHHGHDHLDRFPALLAKMKPRLLALNLNGMAADGERKGKKILPLGQGEFDLLLLKAIRASGWTGPVGILGHTNDDAEERLKDNLDGLAWLLPQLDGKPAGPKPAPRTMAAAPAKPTSGWLAEGKVEYRNPPITVECKVRPFSKTGYNILVACDTKASAAHWELFTMPGSGHLTAYLPGSTPDHVNTTTDIVDGNWHTVAMQYEASRVRLFVDGKSVADQAITRGRGAAVPGKIAFGRLVEGGIGYDGALNWVRLSKGVVAPTGKDPVAGEPVIGLWTFTPPDKVADDLSPLKNTAKAEAGPLYPSPPAGAPLHADSPLKVELIHRSVDDAYMAVKADGTGRLFVGGREAVFVFEPDGRGGFHPRKELLKFPQDSIIIGLEYRGDDLYVLTVNALYLVPNGRTAREGLKPRRLLWGLPQDLHVSFHCLAWGPQGDLYLDHGDPLLNYGDWSRPDHWGHWTLYCQPEGTKVSYTGAGAVLRVRPDGTDVRVVAGGLRGPVGLTFDRNYELFTNDNDHESMADRYAPARLLHVTPQADFGWPRGWMASKSPHQSDLLEPVNSTMGRGVPCDMAYYDEPLIPALRGNLILCRWDRAAVTRFPLRARGATYAAEEIPFLTGEPGTRPTGITADRTGRIFVTSHYLGGNVVTPHCVSDLIMVTRDGVPIPMADETAAKTEDLWTTLSAPSGEVRRRAHTELLRRGGAALAEAGRRLANAAENDPAMIHLPWLLAASEGPEATTPLARVAREHARPEVRLQAVRALAELPASGIARELFVAALADTSDPIKLVALAWFFAAPEAPPVDAVARFAASHDPYLRQTAAILLARRATPTEIAKLSASGDAPTRLVAVLAAGIRLTVPPANAPAPKSVPLHYPAGNAFFHRALRFADAAEPVDLAALGPIGSYTIAQKWKATPADADETVLFELLSRALNDTSAPVKAQAAYYLGLLRDPRTEPGVDRVTRELNGGGLDALAPIFVGAAWLVGPFPDGALGAATEHPLQRGPIDLAAMYPAGSGTVAWRKIEAVDGAYQWPVSTAASTFVYFRVQSRSRQPALLTATTKGVRVWHNGRPVEIPTTGGILLDLQPGSNDVLVRASEGPLVLAVRAKERVTPQAPEKADGTLLADRLKSGGAAIGREFLDVDWIKEAKTGDAERGRKLFGSLGCAKCHAITPDQAGGGAPSLADAGRRFTATYLVESILTPDKQVAQEFRASKVVTVDGQVLTGLVVRESPTEVELLLPDTSRRIIKTADVEERKASPSSPMPAGLVRTPAELRDLLTYLSSDRPAPP